MDTIDRHTEQETSHRQTFFADRDLSWLSFNERVLIEAGKEDVPLLERINFLSIYSSNLDEFYRVRMPALMALKKIKNKDTVTEAAGMIGQQLERFGSILTGQIIPSLKQNGIHLVYNEPIPAPCRAAAEEYFFCHLLAFLQPVTLLSGSPDFFPENNRLYFAAVLDEGEKESIIILNIPSTSISRFFSVTDQDTQYVLFIDDIIGENLQHIFPGRKLKGAYSFKITRDAELDLQDEYEGDIAEKIERQITKRDFGFATRCLYSPDMPGHVLSGIILKFNLSSASVMKGGTYHNLKDLSGFPVKRTELQYAKWPARKPTLPEPASLLQSIATRDLLLNTPYEDYDLVLRFFNEAASDPDTEEIYITLYRIAGDSRIAHALISAAKNGKSVTVFVELKARFDEANNIRWARRMKEAGVKIIYSIPGLKVHAKTALVKKKKGSRVKYYGLFSTGNFNESTARFYTDHILLTAHPGMLRELELLFIYLAKRKKPDADNQVAFDHLLVAQFNLRQRFLDLIDREIAHARKGLPASIIIKLNNLEEETLINKLYEASRAGVSVRMLVRSICRLVPGIKGMSENISIHRIIDRYLEHGRLFVFHNNGDEEIFAGSADWMNRNIYRRIEVCFPIYDTSLRLELKRLIELQLTDNTQAVRIDVDLDNHPIEQNGERVRSQEAIYFTLNQKL